MAYSLLYGDCLNLMRKLPNKSVDLIICDLPYGVTNNDWDAVIPFELLWGYYNKILKSNGTVVLFASSGFMFKVYNSNPAMYKYKWVWVKSKPCNFVNVSNMPMTSYEEALVFSKGAVGNATNSPMKYYPQGLVECGKSVKTYKTKFGNNYRSYASLKSEYVQKFNNYPRDVLYYPSVSTPEHPTQKPTELLEYLIKTYTNEGDLVLDNCMGSGSTGVACVNTNRNFVGMELTDKYFNIAKRRLSEASAELVKSKTKVEP